VLSDARFMLLVFVYSCFWILYFQNFGSVVWYLRDFVDPTPVNSAVDRVLRFFGSDYEFKLDAEHVMVITAGTIVLFQIVVSRIVKNLKPLPTMIGGILLGSLGFLFFASSQHASMFVLGLVTFSLGEMTCHPKYYSYIGLIAPHDKKAVYMGYAFLYGVIGSLVGSNIGGEMYHAILAPLKGLEGVQPTLRNFWLAFSVLGLGATFALAAYHKFFGEDSEVTRRRAKRVLAVVYAALVVCAPGMVLFVYRATEAVPAKTAIQAGIMFCVGLGGLLALSRGARGDKR